MRPALALVLVLLAPALAAGCFSPAAEEAPSGPLPVEELPFPGAPGAFTHLLCANDQVLPLAEARSEACNFRATVDNGPAAEVHLAANPLDPLNLVGGSKDFTLGEDERCGKYNVWSGVYWTRDGGRTWNHTLLPGYPGDARTTALSDYACGSDPVLVFDANGTVYYASIQFTLDPASAPPLPQLGPIYGYNPVKSAVIVARSRDGGETWDDPVVLDTRTGGVFLDKEWMAVDPASGSLYVTYVDTTASTLFVTRSDDGAATWTEPVAILSSDPAPGEGPEVLQFAQVAVTPDGAAHVIYFAARHNGEAAAIHHVRSTDGGATWSEPTVAATGVMPLDLGTTRKYRVVGLPALALDPGSGALYIAYPPRNPADSDILFVASTDGGATWSTAVRVNDDLVGPTNDQWMPALAVGPDGTVHVTWIDYREDPQGQFARIYYAYSKDGGRTWSKNVPVSDVLFDGTGGYHQSGAGTIGDYMGLAVTPLAVHPFWADTRNGRNDVFGAIILAAPAT